MHRAVARGARPARGGARGLRPGPAGFEGFAAGGRSCVSLFRQLDIAERCREPELSTRTRRAIPSAIEPIAHLAAGTATA